MEPAKRTPFEDTSELINATEPIPKLGLNASPESIAVFADLLQEIQTFVETVQEYDSPARLQHVFYFSPSIVSRDAHPEAVYDRLLTRHLIGITLTFTRESNDFSAVTIELHDEDGTIHLSRDLHQFEEDTNDTIITEDGKLQDIPRIPDNEFHTFVHALINPELPIIQTDTYSTPHVIPDEWLDKLRQSAVQVETIGHHELPSGRTVDYVTSSDALTTFFKTVTFGYETADKDRRLRFDMNFENNFKTTFSTFDARYDIGELIPEDGDYKRLRELIEAEIISLRAKKNIVNVALHEVMEQALQVPNPSTDEEL